MSAMNYRFRNRNVLIRRLRMAHSINSLELEKNRIVRTILVELGAVRVIFPCNVQW